MYDMYVFVRMYMYAPWHHSFFEIARSGFSQDFQSSKFIIFRSNYLYWMLFWRLVQIHVLDVDVNIFWILQAFLLRNRLKLQPFR